MGQDDAHSKGSERRSSLDVENYSRQTACPPKGNSERRSSLDIENDSRQTACPPKGNKSYMPRSARSASPYTSRNQTCYDSPRTSMPYTRPLAEHNPRMPRTALSPAPH